MTSKDCHTWWEIPCSCRCIPVEDQLFPGAQRFAFVYSVLDSCSHIFRQTAHCWTCHPSGRSFIQFVANAASYCRLRWARFRKSLISACWRYCVAWIEVTFDLDLQSPRTVRTCHAVGTTCLRDTGTHSSGCRRLPKLWKIHLGVFPRTRVQGRFFFLFFLQPPDLSWIWCQNEKMFTTTDLIFCYGQAQAVLLPYDFLLFRVFGSYLRWHYNDLGVFSLSFDQKPCNSCGEETFWFLVLRSTGTATESPCRSRMALN